jgi:hypothetical protein
MPVNLHTNRLTAQSMRRRLQALLRNANVQDTRMPLAVLREHSLQVLHDCEHLSAHLLILRIGAASCARELWGLRGGLFESVARQHSELEAVNRINALAPYFRGWIPEAQLAPIPVSARR